MQKAEEREYPRSSLAFDVVVFNGYHYGPGLDRGRPGIGEGVAREAGAA